VNASLLCRLTTSSCLDLAAFRGAQSNGAHLEQASCDLIDFRLELLGDWPHRPIG
jgi:hypothetical protein